MLSKMIPKVNIVGSALQHDIEENGHSIRGIAKQLGYISEGQIRRYLKKNEIPEKLLNDIQQIIEPRTKKIWMRLGVTVPVTENELLYLMKVAQQAHLDAYNTYGFEDVDISEFAAEQFMKRAVCDGESYIPSVCFDEHEEWFKQMIKNDKNGGKLYETDNEI